MEGPLVNIKQGKLLGTISQDMNGNPFYSFRGIPYAQPPLGKLRFKAPLPPSSWQGIFRATQNGNCCFSVDGFTKTFVGSEDCLNLNVYTPHLPKNTRSLFPVMVWIHGGSFLSGSNDSNVYGPEFLITEKVVIVPINYRVGLLGFLSLNNPAAGVPGNTAFKDMVMALKWVQTNIEAFNGDPKNVTIFGESAGGGAVHLLTLSTMAKGLFHKAIAQSGCALNPWCNARKADEEVYAAFNYKGNNDVEFLEYLQNLPVEKLLQNQAKIKYLLEPSAKNLYGLVIEQAFEQQGEVPFMTKDPLDIILSGNFNKVPLIMGYTKLEGAVICNFNPKRCINMLTDPECNLPHFLGCKRGTQESKQLAQKVQDFYFGNEKHGHNTQDQLYDMVTDNNFLYGIYTAVRLHAITSDSPIYFYRMSITTSLKFFQTIKQSDREKGAAHGDDVAYLFKTKFTPSLSQDSLEYTYIKTFVKLWTNFAYYGNPTKNFPSLAWEKVTSGEIGFLEIDKKISYHPRFHQTSILFWDKIFSESPNGQKFAKYYSKI